MNIHEKLATIQTKFKTKKSRFNAFGKYYFRSAEDILEAIKPYLLELKVSVIITEKVISSYYASVDKKIVNSETNNKVSIPVVMIKSTAIITDWEIPNWEVSEFAISKWNTIKATAIVGVDFEQKGMQTPQKFGSASSYGKKYALGNLFLIDDTADSDAINTHGKGSSSIKTAEKPVLKGEALKKAKAAIKAGSFTVKDVQKKYRITPAVLKTLN